jgi:hypothetical protein
MGAWVFVSAWQGGKQGGAESEQAKRWMLVGAVAAAAVGGLYFVDYRPPPMPTRLEPQKCLQTSLEFLSSTLGQPFQPRWLLWAAVTMCVLAVCGLACAWAWVRRPAERLRALGLLCFMLGVVTLGLGLGWGRSGFGAGMGFSRRYVTLAVPLACACYFVGVLYLGRVWGRALQYFLLIAAALMIKPNTENALAYARSLHEGKIGSFLSDLRAGLPPLALADRYARYPRALAVPEHRAMMAEYMVMLKDAGVGEFISMQPDPVYNVVPVATKLNASTGACESIFKEPRRVYAVRLKYRYLPLATDAYLVLDWQGRPDAQGMVQARQLIEPVLQEPTEHSLTLWIDDEVSELAIYPDTKPHSAEIYNVELLVPAPTPK